MWQTWPDHWTDRLLFCAQGNSAGRACCSRGPVKHWPVSSTDWPVHGIPVACDVTVPRDNSFTLHVVVTRHVATASDASDALGGGCQATIIRGDKTYVWTTPIRQCCHLWQWISSLLRSAVRPICTLLGDSLTIPVMVVAVTNWSSREPLWSSLWTQWLAGAISGCCFQVKSLGICHGLCQPTDDCEMRRFVAQPRRFLTALCWLRPFRGSQDTKRYIYSTIPQRCCMFDASNPWISAHAWLVGKHWRCVNILVSCHVRFRCQHCQV
jgi:hypothetical protein